MEKTLRKLRYVLSVEGVRNKKNAEELCMIRTS